jgi:hypothetical protein
MFVAGRVIMAFGAGAGVVIDFQAPNIPRSWAVYVNANSGAGALVQVISGLMDITLPVNGHVLFPGRSPSIRLANTVAAAEVTVIALGDDKLKF